MKNKVEIKEYDYRKERLKDIEWLLMIVKRVLEIETKKRSKFLAQLKKLGYIDCPSNPLDDIHVCPTAKLIRRWVKRYESCKTPVGKRVKGVYSFPGG